jgi:hypothetical protein
MGLIYQNAKVTIIAAAGNDETDDLFGVLNSTRLEFRSLKPILETLTLYQH